MPDNVQPRPGQFVARIVGESMNLKVPNGSWALFSTDVSGSKQGKVVLARRKELGDPDDGGRFTLKVYHADKFEGPEGAQYRSIELRPSSTDSSFQPLRIDLDDDDRPSIVAVLVLTLV